MIWVLMGLAGDAYWFSAGFAPSDIGGLKLWLAADHITGLSDGDAVGTWSDLSGQANDATQATPDNKPAYKVNIINGRPVVRFATNDTMLCSSGGGTSLAFFLVGNAGGDTQALFSQNTGAGGILIQRDGVWPDVDLPVIAVSMLSSAGIGSYVFDYSADTYDIYENGTLEASNLSGRVGASAAFQVGAWLTGRYLTGDVAEVVVYNRVLTTAERQGIERYLGGKYAITVS